MGVGVAVRLVCSWPSDSSGMSPRAVPWLVVSGKDSWGIWSSYPAFGSWLLSVSAMMDRARNATSESERETSEI